GAPAITSALSASAQVNQAFSYAITASGSGTITFSATNLPSWMTLSGATLSGTPDAAGTTQVQLTAANSSGSDVEALSVSVKPADTTPPSITDVSISRNPVRTNTDVTFHVSAVSLANLPLTYTWYFFLNQTRDGPALSSASVTRQFALEGEYTAVVVASDGF